MIEFTKVSRTLFRKSKKFRALDDTGRLLYMYLLVTEHINSSGCYQLSEGYAITDLGWQSERFLNGMDTLSKGGLIAWDRDAETVLIEGWVAFNEPANARHAIGILNQLSEVDSETLKHRRFNEIKACINSKKLCNERVVGHDLNCLLNSFDAPFDTVSPQENEKETEIETEKKNEKEREKKTETREEISRQPRPVAALTGDGPPAAKARDRPQIGSSPLLQTRLMRGSA